MSEEVLPAPKSDRSERLRAWAGLFLGSALMFSLEPMLAKMVLPQFGGGASVWTACLLFFQGALLAGYLAAHFGMRLGVSRQAAAVLLLLALGFVFMPVKLRVVGGAPLVSALATLAISAGVPFLALSLLAPSVQRWFVETTGKAPYGLYAASNAGSLVALVSYALFTERKIGLRAQSIGIAIGYVLLFVVILACAIPLWSKRKEKPVELPAFEMLVDRKQIGAWVVLAAVPSAYLAAVTAHVTTEIAPAPLLWVVPLALYLLTFVIVFGGAERAPKIASYVLPPLAVSVVILTISHLRHPIWLIATLHIVTFFVAALVCHGRLAAARPKPKRLTEYFSWVGAGGLLGSVGVAVVAPAVFNQLLEYPILIFMALALRPRTKESGKRDRLFDVGFAVLIGGLAIGAMFLSRSLMGKTAIAVYPCAPAIVTLVAMLNARRFALGVAVMLAGAYTGGEHIVWRSRNWYGELWVTRNGFFNELVNGTTVHGRQSLDPKKSALPTGYYSTSGPLGDVFELARALGETQSVFVIGLGAGGTAAYEQPNEAWTFFEIDPDVVTVARNERLFTYLRDSTAKIVVGDARKEIEQFSGGANLLVIDAFTGDAIPMHLLTLEATQLWANKAHLIAWHVSNRHLDLTPMITRLSSRVGLAASLRDDSYLTPKEIESGKSASVWVVSGPRDVLLRLGRDWETLYPDAGPTWTDDRSSVLDVLDKEAITDL